MNNHRVSVTPAGRTRRLVAGLAVALPVVIGASNAVHAAVLTENFNVTVAPRDADGVAQRVTLASTSANTVWAELTTDPQLSTFAAIVKTAGLEGELSDSTPETVFAPTNDAFRLAGSSVVDALSTPQAAAAYVTSMISTDRPSFLDLITGVPGAVSADVTNVATCVATTSTDAETGTVWVTGQSCESTNVVTPVAAPVDSFTLADGSRLGVAVETVDGTGTDGVTLSFGSAYASTFEAASNGTVITVDTVKLAKFAA
jgi:hypothetical protein